MQWLAELEKALGARDVAALQKLFHADSHWRDILALTWRIGTVSGANADETIQLSETKARYFLIWITKVSPTRDDTGYNLQIDDVTLSS